MDPFIAISDPTRRQVLDLLRRSEMTAGDLGSAIPKLSQPAMSKHLRILREAGLVKVRPEDTRRFYSLKPEGLAELDKWIAQYRPFWNDQLDSLERHLDTQARVLANQLSPKKAKKVRR